MIVNGVAIDLTQTVLDYHGCAVWRHLRYKGRIIQRSRQGGSCREQWCYRVLGSQRRVPFQSIAAAKEAISGGTS
jgi:hypothetical protein